MRPQTCANLLNQLGRAKWPVPFRERDPHGAGVPTSLTRYRRGGPLANHRLVSSGDGKVTFWYRVNGQATDRQRSGLMTWPIVECIRRYLLHVPVPGTRVVRS
jgi:hypothetical protein